MARVFNFSPGPATLPEAVLRQAVDEMLDWHGSGMSVMEMSHRGKEFISIYAEAEATLRELMAIPSNYKVLFLQGGGIGENAFVPMNLIGPTGRADYVISGDWSKKSAQEAAHFGQIRIAANSEENGRYLRTPAQSEWKLDPQAAVALPNFGSRNGPAELEQDTPVAALADRLRALGHDVSVLPLTSGAGAILRERGTWAGGADPRREGTARGERP